MSLESLSSQIEAEAKAEAKEIIKAAEDQAKIIRAEAEAEAENHSVEGLGGFTLESSDGSVLLDYRFDGRLDAAWKKSLSEINTILFG